MTKEYFIVYMHITPNNKKYIGITGRNPLIRWANGNGYIESPYFYNAIKKYGWDKIRHKILIHGLTKEQAIRWEIKLISYYNTTNRKYGYNLTTGGDSPNFTISSRLKMSKNSNKFGVNNPFENIDLLDTMELSKIITFSKDYANYCLENKDRLNSMKDSCFITNSGRVRTTAQAIYCYISNNSQFEEAHTGLEDIDIEIEIFKYSLNLLGNTIVSLNTAPSWRDYSKVVEED